MHTCSNDGNSFHVSVCAVLFLSNPFPVLTKTKLACRDGFFRRGITTAPFWDSSRLRSQSDTWTIALSMAADRQCSDRVYKFVASLKSMTSMEQRKWFATPQLERLPFTSSWTSVTAGCSDWYWCLQRLLWNLKPSQHIWLPLWRQRGIDAWKWSALCDIDAGRVTTKYLRKLHKIWHFCFKLSHNPYLRKCCWRLRHLA